QFGVDQACYRVALISKVNPTATITGGTENKVGDFLNDYYNGKIVRRSQSIGCDTK
ncbi:MAG: hypothetical protein RL074_890, partial [Bacteroidota bacterium]